jgi:acetylornithine/N-succinyldiaminopimelate aminotransferase
VRAVRGSGLIWGLDVVEPANEIVKRGWDEGLLLLTAGEHTVRILPPLIIDRANLAKGVAMMERIIS